MTSLVFNGEDRDLNPVMDYGPIHAAVRAMIGDKRFFDGFIAENQEFMESLDMLEAEFAKDVVIFPPAKRRYPKLRTRLS